MKPETNNEMDLLLRRLGRSAADSPADGNHLDADELSSYTENVLPAAARARCTEHLAECASCRKLVAQLGSSAGVVTAAESVKVSEPSALKKFLASLFAPMVLRYAVPALGLIVVAVIGFTVLRSNASRESVAQLKEPEATAPIVQPGPSESPARGTVDDNRGFFGSPETAPAPRGERSDERSKVTPPAPIPSQTPVVSGRADAQANEAAPVTKTEQPPPASKPAEPKPVTTTDVTATDEVQKKSETEARKEEVTNRSARDLPKATVAGASQADDRSFSAGRPAAPAVGGVANIKRRNLEQKDKVDAETRVAGGRRFRREGGVWIDTAYSSSRSTVNVSRGSEQYRALVADEPVIKSIAEQLDGEIIVVWKGRAYRIR
jgi:hypothetical protein